MMPRVSVIIPVYNVEKYLRACLDSVVNQTLRDIEIICVDDGSTDSSPAILAEYAAKDCRVKVITQPKSNAGAARNAGMSIATGEYLGFVDADDWCELTLFEKAYGRAKEVNADLVFWAYDQFDSQGGRFVSGRLIAEAVRCLIRPFKPTDMDRQIFTAFNYAPWNRLVRRQFAESNKLSFQEQERCNDLYFSCLSIGCAKWIDLVDEVLYHYRILHGGNLQSRKGQTPGAMIRAWQKVVEGLTSRGREEPFRTVLRTDALGSMFYELNGWTDIHVQRTCYLELSHLLKCDPYFSKLARQDLLNSQTYDYYQILTRAPSVDEYLLGVVNYQRNRMSNLYQECVKLRKEGMLMHQVLENAPSLSVIISGEDEYSVDGIAYAVKRQTVVAHDIQKLVRPNADDLRKALHAAGGDGLVVLRSLSELNSPYALERQLLNVVLEKTPNARKSALPVWDSGIVYKRKEVPEAVAEILALPFAAQNDSGNALTENLRNRLSGAAQAFFPLNSLSLIGHYLRLIHEFAGLYPAAEDQKFFAALLHAVDYVRCVDLLSDSDWCSIRNDLDALYNLDYEGVELPKRKIERIVVAEQTDRPDLTYIVPVYNIASYLYRSLESLRRQTLSTIEIVCVDDGSTDETGAILDDYAKQDLRIRVVHKENSGLGMTRNAGMAVARGRYVAFLDGDDWVSSTMAEELVSLADREATDVVSFDLTLYDHKTRKTLPSWWKLSNRHAELICGKIIRPRDLKVWNLQASACLYLFRREFLERTELRFGNEKFGEDLNFSLRMYPSVSRYYILNRVFYHYRRNVPGSQVTRLTAGVDSEQAYVAQRQMFARLAEVLQSVYLPSGDEVLTRLFLRRVVVDVLFYAEKSPRLRAWFAETGWNALELDRLTREDLNARHWDRLQSIRRNDVQVESGSMPAPSFCKTGAMMRIESKRPFVKQDLYIVTGQLNSRANESIDSWTFFCWLCNQGIPARYIVWKEHCRYLEMVDSPYGANVIGLDGDGVADDEFLRKCRTLLVRARAVVQENVALHFNTRAWLYSLKGCAYVFLQHGVFFSTFSDVVVRTLNCCNYVNIASERERDFILGHLGCPDVLDSRKLIVGGLPRWDLVRDLSSEIEGESVILVMPTWRASFNRGMKALAQSAYFNRLRALLCEENIRRWRKIGLRVVFVPHHHLVNQIKDLDFGFPVEMASADQVSYWIRHAKMLVTDFSSVSVDFLFQGKPTIFWTLDYDDPKLDVCIHDDGGKVMSATEELKSLFNVTRLRREVERMIEHYARNGFVLEPEKRAIADTFFAHKKDICRHVYEAVEAAIKRDAEGGR